MTSVYLLSWSLLNPWLIQCIVNLLLLLLLIVIVVNRACCCEWNHLVVLRAYIFNWIKLKRIHLCQRRLLNHSCIWIKHLYGLNKSRFNRCSWTRTRMINLRLFLVLINKFFSLIKHWGHHCLQMVTCTVSLVIITKISWFVYNSYISLLVCLTIVSLTIFETSLHNSTKIFFCFIYFFH